MDTLIDADETVIDPVACLPRAFNGPSDTSPPADSGDDAMLGPEVDDPSAVTEENHIDSARRRYKPLGAPDEFIMHIAAMEFARDALQSPRPRTPEAEAECKAFLAFETGEALGVLATQMVMPISRVTALARAVRALAPTEFDAWVDFQFSNGMPLGLATAKRVLSDLPRENYIEGQRKEGKLGFAAITPVQIHLESFVGILRPRLQAELGAETASEQLDLDAAIDAYLMARRFRLAAESLIAPIPVHADVLKSTRLLEQSQAYDKVFRAMIDRVRTRVQKRTRKVQVGTQMNVTFQVTAPLTEESTDAEAVSA